ncbi:IclR family transcriptional regulator [Georgenia sp. EYE_87]|nr:IclR family transcriptional regulator [Georgenia sp. EYE_87]
MSGNSREPGRTTIHRAWSVLGAFESTRPTMTLTEIASVTGIPLSTVHRLAAELVDVKALERTSAGRYRIGVHLWELASLIPFRAQLQRVALPYMQDLYEATHENVHLAVEDGLEALYIEVISGHKSVRTETNIGRRAPLHATSVGKVMLAFGGDDLLASVGETSLRQYTPYTITNYRRLCQVVGTVKEEQIAAVHSEFTIGVSSVAVPVFNSAGEFAAALTIVARAGTNYSRLVPALRTSASAIGRRLSPAVGGGS